MKIKHLGQICVGPTISKKEIQKVNASLMNDKKLKGKVELYRILSGETRYKLIKLLNDLKELCVCDMAEILDTSVSAVSHQLKILRTADIVETRQKRQTIYYSLKDKNISTLL